MAILNQDVEWMQLSADVRGAFTGGSAEKVLLQPDLKLCKLSDAPTLTRPTSKNVSPWWSPLEAYQYDAGWEERKKLASHLSVSIRELSRILVAVKENWNAMNYLLKMRTTVQVYGFFGGVAGQNRLDAGTTSKRKAGEASAGTKKLVGSASQFYIPNLTTDHVMLSAAEDLGR